MISDLFPQASLLSDFEPLGVSNIIQHAQERDILFIRVTSAKIEKIIEDHLPSSFEGLIVATKHVDILQKYSHVILDNEQDFNNKLDELIEMFYPLRDAPVVGVTGTNGKTSTCWLLSELGKVSQKNVLYIGTIGVFLSGANLPFSVLTTTPSYLEFRRILAGIEKVDLVALEVSSHALAQGRMGDIKLSAGAWTNFTQDHLDYHKTMEEYFVAKEKIVHLLHDQAPLFFNDDKSELFSKVHYEHKNYAKKYSELGFNDDQWFLKADYNKKNFELALALYKQVFPEANISSLATINPPPGRFEVIDKGSALYIVDYAHTPDAVEKVLTTIKSDFPGYYIMTLLGCGGDRDRAKRGPMGQAACLHSDLAILTSDNPRFEEPRKIIEDIVEGLSRSNYIVEEDRKSAIELSWLKAKELSRQKQKVLVVIVGKGHETYQEVKGIRHDFSDADIVKAL